MPLFYHIFFPCAPVLCGVAFTKGFRAEDIQTLPWQIGWLRRWLARFGPVSRLNEDYLAAIYLGWCESLTNRLLNSPALGGEPDMIPANREMKR